LRARSEKNIKYRVFSGATALQALAKEWTVLKKEEKGMGWPSMNCAPSQPVVAHANRKGPLPRSFEVGLIKGGEHENRSQEGGERLKGLGERPEVSGEIKEEKRFLNAYLPSNAGENEV